MMESTLLTKAIYDSVRQGILEFVNSESWVAPIAEGVDGSLSVERLRNAARSLKGSSNADSARGREAQMKAARSLRRTAEIKLLRLERLTHIANSTQGNIWSVNTLQPPAARIGNAAASKDAGHTPARSHLDFLQQAKPRMRRMLRSRPLEPRAVHRRARVVHKFGHLGIRKPARTRTKFAVAAKKKTGNVISAIAYFHLSLLRRE